MMSMGYLKPLLKIIFSYPQAYEELTGLFSDDKDGPDRCKSFAGAMSNSYSKFLADQDDLYESVSSPMGFELEDLGEEDADEEDSEEDSDHEEEEDLDSDEGSEEDSSTEDEEEYDDDDDMEDEEEDSSEDDMEDEEPKQEKRLKKKFAHDHLLNAMRNHEHMFKAMRGM